MKWLLSALAIGTAHAADPASVPAPKVSAGDVWTYAGARSDGKSATFKYEVTRAAAGEIVMDRGGLAETYSTPWTMVRSKSGRRSLTMSPGLVMVPFPLKVGDRHEQKVELVDDKTGGKRVDEIVSTVKGWEDIVVPAGKFRALRIEREEKIGVGSHDPRKNAAVYWYVPELRWHAQVEIFDPAKNLRVTRKLQSYKVR
jgi:hypothetical protein